jgi:uncharacterized protein YcbX
MGGDGSSDRERDGETGTVTSITYAPVKGLALAEVNEVELEPTGVRGDRRFHLITDDGRLVNGKLAGELVQVVATADRDGAALSLQFPDGSTLTGAVETAQPVETSFYGRPVAGRVVLGAFSEALSSFAGRSLRLVRVNEPGAGCDRGVDGAVSAVSTGALEMLAREAAVDGVDPRRFRMLFRIGGVQPHAEDGWVGRRVAVGGAAIRVHGLVGRCAVTEQNPDTGVRDLDTLGVLARYRGDVESEESLPFGVFGAVEQPGRVCVGDPVRPL